MILTLKNIISRGFQLVVGVSDSKSLLLFDSPQMRNPKPSKTPEIKLPPIFLKISFLSSIDLLNRQKLTASKTTDKTMVMFALAVCMNSIRGLTSELEKNPIYPQPNSHDHRNPNAIIRTNMQMEFKLLLATPMKP
jgi:hypothetical protein